MQTSSRKLLVVLIGLLVLGFVVYRSSGMLHLGDFSATKLLQAVRNADLFLLILSVVPFMAAMHFALFDGRFFSKIWAVAFRDDLRPDPGRIFGNFSAGARRRAGTAFVAGAEGEVACFRHVWNYVLERLFDLASAAVIAAIGLLLFKSNAQSGGAASKLEVAARTAGLFFSVGVVGAIAFLVYLRLHGTALLERRLQGWLKAHGWRAKSQECCWDLRGACRRFEPGKICPCRSPTL